MDQIKYEKITKVYDNGEKVLDEVTFGVEKGEFVFIIGPSGAGKTTLIRLLIREQAPTEGAIYFSELVPEQEVVTSISEESDPTTLDEMVNIFDLPDELLPELRRRVGVVFQDFKVLKSKNVFENVAVALEVVDAPKNTINDVVTNVLGLVGLSDKKDMYPRQLSGGEIQRLSIARALAHEPDVLVADEPTGMIDPKATDEVLRILEKINSLGTTIIMATHNQEIVDKMKKRVIRLEKGKVKSDKKSGKYND
jgi:cell division transport system ATP-binding protein